MRPLLLLGLLVAGVTSGAKADDKTPQARVTLCVKEPAGVVQIEKDGKAEATFSLELEAGKPVEVKTERADILGLGGRKADLLDLATKRLLEGIRKSAALKGEEKTQALAKVRADHKEEMASLGFIVCEGRLIPEGQGLRLHGTIRLYDPRDKDKGLLRESAVVVGQPVKGEFRFGKDGKAGLAIKDGEGRLLVTFPKGKEPEKLPPLLRVTGKLRLVGNALVFDAEKAEPAKE